MKRAILTAGLLSAALAASAKGADTILDKDPVGIYVTIVSVVTVLSALIVLFLLIQLFAKVMVKSAQKKAAKSKTRGMLVDDMKVSVPAGCDSVVNGEIIAAAHNTRETEKNALHHAELLAIDAACKKLGGWRLWQCELFVTLEPCPMCSGGIINSRIRRVVYGAADTKAGCCGSVTDLFALPFNHHPVVERGLRAEEAQALLQAFFLRLREQRAAKPRWKPPVTP